MITALIIYYFITTMMVLGWAMREKGDIKLPTREVIALFFTGWYEAPILLGVTLYRLCNLDTSIEKNIDNLIDQLHSYKDKSSSTKTTAEQLADIDKEELLCENYKKGHCGNG